jgi:hypothetical protein
MVPRAMRSRSNSKSGRKRAHRPDPRWISPVRGMSRQSQISQRTVRRSDQKNGGRYEVDLQASRCIATLRRALLGDLATRRPWGRPNYFATFDERERDQAKLRKLPRADRQGRAGSDCGPRCEKDDTLTARAQDRCDAGNIVICAELKPPARRAPTVSTASHPALCAVSRPSVRPDLRSRQGAAR